MRRSDNLQEANAAAIETVHGGDCHNRYVFTLRIVDRQITEGWEHLDSAYFDVQMSRGA